MSYSTTAPIDIPTPLFGTAGANSSRFPRRPSRPPRGRNPAHDTFQIHTPSMDEGAKPRTPSIERTPPQRRTLDPSEDPAARPRTASMERTPPSSGLGLPASGKISTTPTPSADSSANTTTSPSEEPVPDYEWSHPYTSAVRERVHPLSAKVQQRRFGAPARRAPGTPTPTEITSPQHLLTPSFETPLMRPRTPSAVPDSPADESEYLDDAIPESTRSQSRPPDMEPARHVGDGPMELPVGASHRDLTITDSTPRGKEKRFSFSFNFPPALGFVPPSPAVPQQQQTCPGCAEVHQQIEEQLQRIRRNQEAVARQLAELEQRDARRQLRDAEEETWKREDTQLASLLEALRAVETRLVEVTTDARRREDEHREQSERREATLQRELETTREAQQSERKRAQEKWDALLETLQQRTETLMRAWRDAESQRAGAVAEARCSTDQEHAAAVAEAVTTVRREADAQRTQYRREVVLEAAKSRSAAEERLAEAVAQAHRDAEQERATAVAEAAAAARRETEAQLAEAAAQAQRDADQERATAVAEATAAARRETEAQLAEAVAKAVAKARRDADHERSIAVAEAVAEVQREAESERVQAITTAVNRELREARARHKEAIREVKREAESQRATAVTLAVTDALRSRSARWDQADISSWAKRGEE